MSAVDVFFGAVKFPSRVEAKCRSAGKAAGADFYIPSLLLLLVSFVSVLDVQAIRCKRQAKYLKQLRMRISVAVSIKH
jgi:hypothetical protein